MPEALGLSLEERKSTATLQLGPEDPEIPVGSWLLDDEPGTGEGIVWRTRSADMTFNTDTRQLTLEHIISTLQDAVLFGEHTYEDIAGAGASTCSARAAAQYILARQSLWTLGDFDFDDIAWPYKFNGDTLFSALQTVTNSCPDACWEYDLSRIPFRVHIRRISSETTCEMRAGRNIRTLKRVIDRSGMYTRFYPIGKDDLHISGDYISKNESVYGMVAKVETFSGAETESSLRSWAWERLNRHCEPKVTVTIGGLDLSESTGESLDRLTIGRKCRVPLPEFGTTITERITRIRVTDKIRKKEEVTVTLGNELPDLASIVGDVEKEQASGRGGGGRGGMKQAGEDHAWFVDTDEHVGMVAEAIIGHGPDGVDWSRVAEVIVDGNGIHNRVTRAEGYLVVMEAKIDLTEEKLRAEFTDVTASLRSELEMSAASLRVEFENLNNSTRSELLITSESLRTEFTNEINSTRSELQITSQSLRVEFENLNNSTRSELLITSESLRSTIQDTKEGLQSQISQNAGQIALRVAKGDVGTQLAVELGNVSISGGNLVVDGYVTAAGLDAAIANLDVVHVKSIQAAKGGQGNLSLTSVTAQSSLYVGTEGGSVELISAGIRDAVVDLNLAHTAGTATYTLQKKTISSHSGWTDVGTFSKAAKLSVEYGGDNSGDTASYTVTGTPAENFPSGNTATGTFTVHESKAAAYITDGNGVIRARINNPQYGNGWAAAYAEVSLPTTSSTAASFSVKTPKSTTDGGANTETYTMSSATNDVAIVKNIAGTVVARLEHGKYTAGVTAGEAKFSLVDITLQGASESVYVPDSANGTTYYTAGTQVARYKGDGTRLGSSGTYYKGNGTRLTTATRYNSGNKLASGTYYLGDGSSVTGRGTKVSVTAIGNAVHFKRHTSGKPSGTYYTIVSSGYDLTYYLSKSAADYYQGNGSSVTGRGTSVTAYVENNAGSYYLRGSSETVYVSSSSGGYYLRGDSVTAYPTDSSGSNYLRGTAEVITPIGATSIKVTNNTRYKAGTRYNKTKYYEKTA